MWSREYSNPTLILQAQNLQPVVRELTSLGTKITSNMEFGRWQKSAPAAKLVVICAYRAKQVCTEQNMTKCPANESRGPKKWGETNKRRLQNIFSTSKG